MPVLVVALVTVPIVEVWLLIEVGQLIGVWPTVALVIAEAILGAWLIRREGGRAWQALVAAFASARMPARQLTDAALVLTGGLLLLLPGFVTDAVGLACLLPLTRPWLRRLLTALVTRQLARSGLPVPSGRPRPRAPGPNVEGPDHGGHGAGTIVEGEVVPPGTSSTAEKAGRTSPEKDPDSRS